MYGEPLTNVHWRIQGETFWRPPTDVYETDDSAVVIVEIAGLAEGAYSISLSGRMLVVTGERTDPGAKLAYQQMEIRYGKFRTEVHLPWALDTGDHSATYESGFLKIRLRKAQVHRIPVNVA